MSSKSIAESKSIWFNVLSIMSVMGASLLADENFRELIDGYAMYLIIGMNVVNIGLRKYTTKPIHVKKPLPKLNPIEQALRDDDLAIKDI